MIGKTKKLEKLSIRYDKMPKSVNFTAFIRVFSNTKRLHYNLKYLTIDMVTAKEDQYENIVNTLCKLKSLVFLNITASEEQKYKLP